MAFIIIILIILILFLVGPWTAGFVSQSRRNAIIGAAVLSLLLVPITIFLLNQERLVLNEQTEFIESSSGIRNLWHEYEQEKKWLSDNFIFIDDSYSNQLVELPGSNKLGNSKLNITNRSELDTLFRFLMRNGVLTNMIICDIYMDVDAPGDNSLREILAEPQIEAKLVIAKNSIHANTRRFASLNDSVYGVISEKGIHEGMLFATFSPMIGDDKTLAYQVYRKWQHLDVKKTWDELRIRETSGDGTTKIGLNSYIPAFFLTEESELYGPVRGETEGSLSGYNYFELGDFGNSGIQRAFSQLLQQRIKENKKNIIFIGSFKGEDIDVHNTYFGKLHGSTILLNIIYSLYYGQHLIPFSYLFYLWMVTGITLYILIRISFQQPLLKKRAKISVPGHGPEPGSMAFFARSIIYVVFIHPAHTWLLIVITLLTYLIWDKIINCFALIVLFHFIAGFFSYYHHHSKSSVKK